MIARKTLEMTSGVFSFSGLLVGAMCHRSMILSQLVLHLSHPDFQVSNTRPEDNKIRQEDLSKILASVQSVHSKQENIDVRLATLKRENEALWTEISNLRQKHSQQQQLIKKLIHFIVTLVQNNRILNLKRKRWVHSVFDLQPSA